LLRRRWAAAAALALSLGGCTPLHEYVRNGFKVGPNYREPPAPVAAGWIEETDPRVRKERDDLSQWWTVFNDPALVQLIDTAYRQNLTLREAGFRVLAARAQLGIAVGELFPQTQYMNGDFVQRNVSLAVANKAATPQRSFPQWDYGFGLAWELDFWGKFRRGVEQADDNFQASGDDYDAVLVTTLGDVAANYVQLRTNEQQLEYLKQNIEIQQESLRIARARFKAGATTELDVDQAEVTLTQTQSQVHQQEIAIRQSIHRLCVLIGIPPEDLRAKLGPAPIPTPPTDVGPGVPADLVRRRPDVRRQERLAAAQCAAIGIADADFYPAISINGTIGYSAQQFGRLFSQQGFRGSVGPSFQWNILEYGRLINNVRQQRTLFEVLVATYQQQVLTAAEEVENGLVTFLESQGRARSLEETVAAAEKGVKVAIAQYAGGKVDYNRVAVLEQNLVQQQQALADARGQVAQGLVQVYRALGGGWEIRCAGGAAPLPQPERELLPPPRPVESGQPGPDVGAQKAGDGAGEGAP
jgi:NodT family efflux transporter outer membrane factor (OMF) lipoprotein